MFCLPARCGVAVFLNMAAPARGRSHFSGAPPPMIAIAKPVRRKKAACSWHQAFEPMIPAIRQQARYAFRNMRPEAKADAIAEVLASCCCAYARLVERGMAHVANPSALTRYAVRQFRDGRRVGNKLNVRDVTSEYCQRRKRITVERLDQFEHKTGKWNQVLVEDRHAGPADTAAARIDVGDWFRGMRPKVRRVAQALAIGERTKDVAKKFKLSAGRISQLRSEFYASWRDFQGEAEAGRTLPA